MAFTPDDLREMVPISELVMNQAIGTDTLDRGAAVNLLIQRFAASGGADIKSRGDVPRSLDAEQQLFGFIVDALPEEMRETGILQNLDLRPWLKVLQGKKVDTPRALDRAFDTSLLAELESKETTRIYNTYMEASATSGLDFETRKQDATRAATVPGTVGPIKPPEQMAPETQGTGFAPVAAGTEQLDPTVSVEDLRKAFIQSYSTDLLDLEAIAYQMQGQNALDSVSVDVFEPTTTYFRPGAGGAPTNERMNLRAAVDYLYSGQVTPREITVLQKRMVAAGFFDEVPQGGSPGFVTGDAFDDNTNRAWRNLLAQAFTRQMSVDEVLAEGTQQRRQRLPDLTKNINRSVFNATAQNVIGRNLTDAEQEGVISYIQNLQQEQGLAAADPALGYDPAALTEYMTDEFKGEMDRVGGIVGSNNFITAMKGL